MSEDLPRGSFLFGLWGDHNSSEFRILREKIADRNLNAGEASTRKKSGILIKFSFVNGPRLDSIFNFRQKLLTSRRRANSNFIFNRSCSMKGLEKSRNANVGAEVRASLSMCQDFKHFPVRTRAFSDAFNSVSSEISFVLLAHCNRAFPLVGLSLKPATFNCCNGFSLYAYHATNFRSYPKKPSAVSNSRSVRGK